MSNKIYIGIIAILMLLAGWLAYKVYKQEGEIIYISKEYEGLDQERIALAIELEQMKMGYDSLQTDNDSMMTAVLAQREEIDGLLAKIKNKNYEVSKLKKEAETLRTIMKGYIHDIDSLNQLTERLASERDSEKMRADRATAVVKEQEGTISLLDQAVKASEVLQASTFVNTGIRLRSSGKQDDTDRASQCDMLKSCFTIRKSVNAKPGTKIIYMRIMGPNANMLPNKDGSTTIKVDGVDEPYSVSREVDYQREDLDACVYYTVQQPLEKGNYKIYVYESGKMIGQSDLVLR